MSADAILKMTLPTYLKNFKLNYSLLIKLCLFNQQIFFKYKVEKYLGILLFFRVPTDVSLQTPLKQQPASLYLTVSDLGMTLFKIAKSKN